MATTGVMNPGHTQANFLITPPYHEPLTIVCFQGLIIRPSVSTAVALFILILTSSDQSRFEKTTYCDALSSVTS